MTNNGKLTDLSRHIVNGKYTPWKALYEDNKKMAAWVTQLMGGLGAIHLHACGIGDAIEKWQAARAKCMKLTRGPDLDLTHCLGQILLLTKPYAEIGKQNDRVDTLSKNTLKLIDQSAANLKDGKASAPIDLKVIPEKD